MRTKLSKFLVILAYALHPLRTVKDGLTHLEGVDLLPIEYFTENGNRLSALRERCGVSIREVQAATKLPLGLILFVEGKKDALVGMYHQASIITNSCLVEVANQRGLDISDILLEKKEQVVDDAL